MTEDITTIVHKGFSTWKRNLAICVPFIMEVLMTFVLFFIFTVVFVMLFILPGVSANNLDLEQLSPEEFLAVTSSLLSGSVWSIVAFGIVFILIYMFLQSFFMAGAIGMSKEASQRGDTSLRDMSAYGMRNVVSLFLAKILILLLSLAGIVFTIPGILSIGDLGTLLNDPQQAIAGTSVLLFGLLIWGFYLLAISIVLIFVQYALVIENLDPVSAIEKGVAVFMSNKSGALSLWLLLMVIAVVMQLFGEIAGYIDVVAQVWSLTNIMLTLLMVQPLTTIWWTRLYLNRNGKKLYSLDDYILDH
ncbi:hypothetical protein [Methanolobus sp.]|uniref:DUF7847 domain-containing protein n=1 Tax=Methanolobus sp. TaxID=1874737 RepID=UPI0025E2F175|nr:hypothetical protein [Methanolobus sp.]